MPIERLLQGRAFGPDEIKVLSSAFEAALIQLNLTDRTDPRAQAVAKRIIELAQQGERDPVRLREGGVKAARSLLRSHAANAGDGRSVYSTFLKPGMVSPYNVRGGEWFPTDGDFLRADHGDLRQRNAAEVACRDRGSAALPGIRSIRLPRGKLSVHEGFPMRLSRRSHRFCTERCGRQQSHERLVPTVKW